jgi:hypothetical protein
MIYPTDINTEKKHKNSKRSGQDLSSVTKQAKVYNFVFTWHF